LVESSFWGQNYSGGLFKHITAFESHLKDDIPVFILFYLLPVGIKGIFEG